MAESLGDAVVRQAFEFWINPEIERREKEGTLPSDFALSGAQVIFQPDAGAPEVRLNDEVKAVASVKVNRDIAKGENVLSDDVDAYDDILLTEEDPNAGHITIVPHKGHWAVAFDFRRNAARIAEHSEAARAFLDVAAWSAEQRRMAPFVDNLFSAVELMAKGLMIWMPDKQLLEAKSHGLIHARFNHARKMNNVDPAFADLLNRLASLRRPARYLSRTFALSEAEMNEMLTVAERMHATLEASRPRRATVST